MEKTIDRMRELKNELNIQEESIQDVLCYGRITLSKNDANKKNEQQKELYLVKKEKEGKEILEFYTQDGKIAQVNSENEITILPEYKNLINEKELLLQLRDITPVSLNKLEELENKKQEDMKEHEEEEKNTREENSKDIIIDMNKKITKTKTIAQLIPEIQEKNIESVRIRRVDSTKFEVYGINAQGEEVDIESIKQTEGTNPYKEIVEVNQDGSTVTKDTALTMLKIENGTNEEKGDEGFTISIGDYGTPEVNYYRRDRATNQYTSVPVNLENTNQKKTSLETREYIEKKTNSSVQDNIERAEQELEENDETQLENIDDNPYNDENSIRILLEKAAARCKVSYEAFVEEYEKTEGNTIDERIDEAEEAINEQFRGEQKR